ncbi:MAG: hypothetical protein U5K28_05685 [Halobacteriales archaeon]|nr:hypothetical protein [Halobacteriales archaeon]
MCSEGGDAAGRVRFTSALARLKHDGGSILVVGETDAAHIAACTRLQGDDRQDRQRVVVQTDNPVVPTAVHAPDVTNLRYPSHNAEQASYESDVDSSVRPATTAAQLQEQLSYEMTRTANTPGGDRETGVRICFDAVTGLRDHHDERELFQLLDAVTTEIRAGKGMGHFHLLEPFDDELVEMLCPLFDAILDLREEDDSIQQRWWLAATESWTEWLSL